MTLHELWSKSKHAVHANETSAEIDEELQFHIQKQTEANILRGMSPEEARRQALIALGGAQQTRERVWRENRFLLLDHITQDVSFALRGMRKRPFFTAVAIGILTLGLGANTAIFAIAKSILLDKMPFREPEQIVAIREATESDDADGMRSYVMSAPNFEEYSRRQRTFEALSFWIDQSVNFTGGDRPERVVGSFISANFFDMLGVAPILGRSFTQGEDQPGAARRVVLAYHFWRDRFGSERGVLGRNLTLNGDNYEIIGVLPASFGGLLSDDDVYMPIFAYPNYRQGDRNARAQLVFGRIKSGVTYAQAAADLDVVAQQIAKDFPQHSRGIRIALTPVTELRTDGMRPMLRMLLVAVGLVLLLACANVANLLLARGAERTHELSVRAALGASRGRILQQLMTEAMLLALISGLLASLLAHWTIKALLALNPVPIPYAIHPHIDAGVIAFIFALSVITGLVFGSVPVLQLIRPEIAHALSSNPRTSSGSKRAARIRSAFVAFQLAICFVLLIGSGLLLKTWFALLKSDPGFNTHNLLTLEYRVPRVKYDTRQEQWTFHHAALEKIKQVPGIEAAALVQALPFSGNYGEMRFFLPGQQPEPGKEPTALTNMVTPGYFGTVRLPLLQGRDFTDHDDANASTVAIIDRTMQQKYFPGVDPIGRELLLLTGDTLPDGSPAPPKRAMIVGVAADAKYIGVREEHRPQIYVAYAQNSGIFASLVVRAAGDPMALQEAIRQAVWSVDKDQPMWKIRTMEALIERGFAPEKALLYLMCAFGALAVLLSAAGTYAVISHSVTRRTQEFGVRLALGASRSGIVQLVLSHSVKVAVVGVAVGVAAAIVTSRLLRTILFNVSATDATTYLAALLFITGVALIASALPAMRASRIDPSTALRYE